jgi:hypothetical protein
MQQLGGDTLKQIGGQIGADEGQTQQAVGAALPALLGALGQNAAKPQGARALANALQRDHDGSILDDLGGFLSGGGNVADGNGILRHTLGEKRGAVEQGISAASGLDLSQIGQLLPLLAPVVMGILGRTQRQQGLDVNGLASMLGGERQQAESMLGGVGGLDLSQLLGGSGGSGGSSRSGGLLGMLGRLLGRG